MKDSKSETLLSQTKKSLCDVTVDLKGRMTANR